jgi:hypothetical protein
VLAARADTGAPAPTAADCARALLPLADEPPGPSRPVPLAPSTSGLHVLVALGLASDCTPQARAVIAEMQPVLGRQGYRIEVLGLSGLTSSAENARRLRDAVLADRPGAGRLVIVGHSKGVVDSLQALVDHPAIRPRVAALVSLAGAVGGSPLANLAPQDLLKELQALPGMECEAGDLLAVDSLKPVVRQRWLAEHPLPPEVRYFSVVALPEADRVSSGLRPTYRMLSRIDQRNDGNLLSQDQLIPQGTLLGLVNADHWAVMSNLRASPLAGVRWLADRNDFPRAALMEAVLRYVDEQLGADGRP